MQDNELYQKLLGLPQPWFVSNVDLEIAAQKVTVSISHPSGVSFPCPVCGYQSSVYDHQPRRWRHLDTCGFTTIIECDVPRVQCSVHGVKQVTTPWGEAGSRFTALFEAVAISWLQVTSISDVAEQLGLSWDEVDGIMQRAVRRGLARRKQTKPKHIGIDETAFQKRHEYVTVLLDKETDSVIDILEDRKAVTLRNWFESQEKCDFSSVQSITMDMWDPFINAVSNHFPNAQSIIAFDRFHVAQHFGKALDKVRAEEHRSFLAVEKESPLTRSKHQWLKNSSRTDNRESRRRKFLSLSRLNLKTARAWRIKEAASLIWNYSYIGVAEKRWKRLLFWISHCRLSPVIAVGKMIRKYFWGILNAIRLKTNNSMLEAKNARIQHIKKMACGFRNRDRFKNSILFHLGGLDLYPVPTR